MFTNTAVSIVFCVSNGLFLSGIQTIILFAYLVFTIYFLIIVIPGLYYSNSTVKCLCS